MRYDFSEKFKRPYFTGKIKKLKRNSCWGLLRDKHKIVQHEEPKMRTKGCVDTGFIKKHKLIINTRPEEYVDIFMPLKNNTHRKKKMLIFDMITRWFNMKTILAGSGKRGTPFQFFSVYSQQILPIFWPLHHAWLVPISDGINSKLSSDHITMTRFVEINSCTVHLVIM